MCYRRTRIAGVSYFFTAALADRRSGLLVEYVDLLRSVLGGVRQAHPFEIDAMVVLPDHLHAIWTLPGGDADFSLRWMLIKAGFSRQMPALERCSPSRRAKGERGIWQRRFREHLIRDDRDFGQHVNYIHFNPVKHGLVARAAHWPHSLIHRYIRTGLVAPDWGWEGAAGEGFGE